MDAELFSANNLKKITDLIGKKLHLGTSMFIRQIPLIAQLVERRTILLDQNLTVILRSVVEIRLSGCSTIFCKQFKKK